MNSQVWWYLSRASGLVAWGLATGSVILGLWVSLRLTRIRPRPAWTLDLHRYLGALTVAFTGVHLAGLVADSYVSFGVADLLLPGASSWRPEAVAVGVVAMYGLLAIETTSLLMRKLPRRLWRGVHLTSYLVSVLATVHMLAAGTDSRRWLVQWVALVGTAVVVFLTITRVLATRDRPSPVRPILRRDAGRAAPARTHLEPVATAPR